MAESLQIDNLPDSIRAQYARSTQDLDAVQMAKEVPRQYQRNSEDVQLLKFPSTKNILWDHVGIGDPHTLHISCYRKPKLSIHEKVLRFAQRHLESTNQKSCGCVLVGTVAIDDDGEGVVFAVERLDPAGDPNTSSSHAAGDMLIPFTIQRNTKERGSTVEDYTNALQLLKQRCCSKDPIDLGNFLLTKGWCSFYTNGDKCVHHLEFEVVTMGTEIKATPIEPVPIVPTALSKNLSGPMSISHMQGTPKTGYLTMDHTRKLLLVLESDPKVINLPLVGIWVSGVTYAYSPYVWACCLRYLHNSSIQDRVCSPPDPFLLVLYNPSHSKPEFYECSTVSGTSKMEFDFYTGYEAVQLNKGVVNSSVPVEIDMEHVQTGSRYDMFSAALQQFSSQLPEDESRRPVSPETASHEDITPRLQPAPYQSKMMMAQSMVPEVSLFFGDEDTTFVPNVQHPRGNHPGLKLNIPKSESRLQHVPKSVPQHSSPGIQTNSSMPNSINSAQTANLTQNGNSTVQSVNSVQNNFTNVNYKTSQNGAPNHSQDHAYQQKLNPEALSTQYPPQPTYLSSQQHPPVSASHHPMYPTFPTGHGSHGPRPGFCSCPSCPKPQPYYGNGPQRFDGPRGQLPPPRHIYPNYGPPPPRLGGPQNGYPPNQHHSGGYQVPPLNNMAPPYPLPRNEYSGPHMTSYVTSQPPSGNPAQMSNSNPQFKLQQENIPNYLPNSASSNNMIRPSVGQPVKQTGLPPVPQASGGLPARSEDRTLSPRTPVPSSEFGQHQSSGNQGTEVRRSNTNSDNSGRSSDDSGLSFTPEKHNSPSTSGPKTSQDVATPAGMISAGVNWENVPPEVYQLLLQQDKQLKQMQAQIEFLTTQQAQSLNNTADSQNNTRLTNTYAEKCNIATNTSMGFGEQKEQVSACMQTSQQNSLQNSRQSDNTHRVSNKDMSRSSSNGSNSSGCETRTPLEIRHRGKLPMNSTQREDVELDMSQGELVALMNNMHDKTIDSVQSEMIVDLPSFQSSPSRSPRSQESYCDSNAFNMSPRSPISASMCEREQSDSESEDTDDEGDNADEAENTAGTDNTEYYNKLMDNIKKLLHQNTSTDTYRDDGNGYQGDVSSDPSTPIKLAKQDIQLGAQLQSFFKMDEGNKAMTDTTFIPKINYVSMLLDSDNDTSMEINAMAMKYLKDEQLTQLTKLQAKNRLLKGPKHAAEKTAMLQRILKAEDGATPNVTTFGMSPNDLTFATKKYMEKHGLFDGTTSGGSTSDSTYNDSYRLKTNYSTMSSGSEDGPAYVTHEVLSTPDSRRTDLTDTITPSSGKNSNGIYSNGTTPTQDRTRTPYNDSRQSLGSCRTPKPSNTQSRTVDHRRFNPNGNDSHNCSVPQSHNSSAPYTHDSSPFTQNTSAPRRDNNNIGANGRYASPQITPAPNRQKHSPPEREMNNHPRRYPNDLRQENEGFTNNSPGFQGRQAAQQKRSPVVDDRGVANYFHARQYREETNEDDRILDITRLKQLPKLL